MPKQVQAFTTTYAGRSNVLTNKVLVAEAFDLSVRSTPSTKPQEFMAIWDTGATNTVITQKIVDACGLRPTGQCIVHTPNGQMITDTYLISLMLPNNAGIPELKVSRGQVFGDAEVLIGMDIIGAGDFAVTNNGGKTTFSFRIPSTTTIDFVKEINAAKNSTPPMNRAERRRLAKKSGNK